jgi:hypothetical protein
MLIAEELVLLALHPDGTMARGASSQTAVAVGVTGALVTELALDGHLDVSDGRIRLTGTRPTHPLLAQALDHTAPHAGKKLKSRLGSIKHAGWSEVVDGMIAAGIVGRETAPLRPTRHPVKDLAAQARLLAEVRAAAVGVGPLEPRVATLLALAGPCQLLEVVAPDRADRKAARRRIDTAADQVPAAAAVKATVQEVQAAVMAAVTTSTIATSG